MEEDVKETDELADGLIARVERLLENAEPSPDSQALEEKLNDMKARWSAVKDKTAERQKELEKQAPVLHDYHNNVDDFAAWLAELDKKARSKDPVSCDEQVIAEQQEDVQALLQDLEDHKPEFEAVKGAADQVVVNQPDDVYVVEAQVQYVTKLWESVALRLDHRRQQLADVRDLAEEYRDVVKPVQELLARSEEGLIPLENVGCDADKAKRELNNTKVGPSTSCVIVAC